MSRLKRGGYLRGLSSPSVTERSATRRSSPRSKEEGHTRFPTFSMTRMSRAFGSSSPRARATMSASRWHRVPVVICTTGSARGAQAPRIIVRFQVAYDDTHTNALLHALNRLLDEGGLARPGEETTLRTSRFLSAKKLRLRSAKRSLAEKNGLVDLYLRPAWLCP